MTNHVVAPEVRIDANPVLLELCSDHFSISNHNFDLAEIEKAADEIRKACEVTATSINMAKANLLRAYMGNDACKKWVKKEFQKRLDCDARLLDRVAREEKFRYYTNEKLVVEDMENHGEESPLDEIEQRTGVSQRVIKRIQTKIQRNHEIKELNRVENLEQEMQRLNDKHPGIFSEDDQKVSLEQMEPEKLEVEVQEEVEDILEIDQLELKVDQRAPEASKTILMTPPKVFAQEPASKTIPELEAEISELKQIIAEKDQEIKRLNALLTE
ncbi:MAG: hypothetical protein MK193_13125 [Lentisphaeria bacterium]|nr:hypothetical protein [Lentisphaeria bacterium]